MFYRILCITLLLVNVTVAQVKIPVNQIPRGNTIGDDDVLLVVTNTSVDNGATRILTMRNLVASPPFTNKLRNDILLNGTTGSGLFTNLGNKFAGSANFTNTIINTVYGINPRRFILTNASIAKSIDLHVGTQLNPITANFDEVLLVAKAIESGSSTLLDFRPVQASSVIWGFHTPTDGSAATYSYLNSEGGIMGAYATFESNVVAKAFYGDGNSVTNLSDVNINSTTATDGQVLTYSITDGHYIPSDPIGGIGSGITLSQSNALIAYAKETTNAYGRTIPVSMTNTANLFYGNGSNLVRVFNNPSPYNNSASDYSFAMGYNTTASSIGFAMGENTVASGGQSTSLGNSTAATGAYSLATGLGSVASSTATFASGNFAYASGVSSFIWSGWDPNINLSTIRKTNSVSQSFQVNAPGGIRLLDGIIWGNGLNVTNFQDTNMTSAIATNTQVLTYNAALGRYFPSNSVAVGGSGITTSQSNAIIAYVIESTNAHGRTVPINMTNAANQITAVTFNADTVNATNIQTLFTNKFLKTDSDGIVVGTVDAGVLTNVIATNIVFTMTTFPSVTNTLTLNNSYWLLQSGTDCAITNVNGQIASTPKWATLWVSNSSASQITFWWTAGGSAASSATNQLQIPSGKMAAISVFGFGTLFTNYSNTTFQ